jgi:hypothetical protein
MLLKRFYVPFQKSTSEVCTRSQKQQKHSFSWIIHSLLHWGHKRSCFSRETVFKKVGAKAELPKISTKQVLKVAKSAQPSFHSKFLSLVLKNCLTFFLFEGNEKRTALMYLPVYI